MIFLPDGSKLASGSDNKTVQVWDVITGQVDHTLKGHLGSVYTVAFSPNGSKLASGSGKKTVRVWDVATGQVDHTLKGYSGSVNTIWAFNIPHYTATFSARRGICNKNI